MPPDDLFPDYVDDPDERSDLPVWRHRPRYAQTEMGRGKERELWHGRSTVCPVCQQEIISVLTEAGEYLELCVRRRTFRLRLNATKSGLVAERGRRTLSTCARRQRRTRYGRGMGDVQPAAKHSSDY